MSKKNVVIKAGGTSIGLPTILTALFVYLKLTDQIDWSWFWVTSPAWIPFAVVFGICLIVIIVTLIGAVVASLVGR